MLQERRKRIKLFKYSDDDVNIRSQLSGNFPERKGGGHIFAKKY